MLAAFAEAARLLDRADDREVSERNAGFLLRELRQENGRVPRTWQARLDRVEGAGDARVNGYLENYAYLISALLELAGSSNETSYVDMAQQAQSQEQSPL